ncbi:MAG: group II intron reverse transcriptase/maturase [Microthrixaceae bacterium]|nr:group II intron reverse transcriptase/maturase [Microthrixaceae bacterium]
MTAPGSGNADSQARALQELEGLSSPRTISVVGHATSGSDLVVAVDLKTAALAKVDDRVVQAALKLVLEPIFEADFRPCSHGFRPGRRAHDAIAEIRHLTSVRYEWVLEGDIKACFDEIDHTALLDRVRHRIGDKRVVALVKAFLKAGVLSEDGIERDTDTGTPQGGILSPLLANIALSVLDDHFAETWQNEMATTWQRKKRRNHGHPNYRLIRYADDFVVVIHGERSDAEALRQEVAAVLGTVGLVLSETKTTIAHIDEGFDFLGWRIQRHRKRGTAKHFVYTYPSKTSLGKVTTKVKTLSRQGRNEPLCELLRRLNPVLRGWTNYFRHGVSKATFGYLRAYTWARVVNWLRRKHPRANWKWLRRRYLPGWWPTEGETTLFDPNAVPITWARYRGQLIDTTPWKQTALT